MSSTCTCFHLRRAARVVSQLFDRELARVDLSLNEYSILRHARAGARSLTQLAQALGMDRSTLTRNLKPLLDEGWLAEVRGIDARQKLIAISVSGRARVNAARPHWKRAQALVEANFGDTATQHLHEQLERLCSSLREGIVA